MTHVITDQQLRRQLLTHQIETAKAASKRAMSIWIAGSILAYVVAVATFNAKFSWNRSQLNRRAQLVRIFQDKESLKASENETWVKNILIKGEGFLGYFKTLIVLNGNSIDYERTFETERQRILLAAAQHELNLYASRQVALDTVKIPIIGTDITGTDIGIIGGLAVTVIGLWLLACLKREYEIICEFMAERGRSKVEPPDDSYSDEENLFAFKCISTSLVLGMATKGSLWVYAVRGIYLIPLLMFLIIHVTTVFDSAKFDWPYWDIRNILELTICISVWISWLASLKTQMAILRLLEKWKEKISASE